MPAQGSRCLFQHAAANKDVIGIEGGDSDKMLMPASASGFRMAARTPMAENSSFPSTVNALHPASHVTPWGTSTDGQTMEQLMWGASDRHQGLGAKDSAMRESSHPAAVAIWTIPRLAVEEGDSWLRKQSALLPRGGRGSRASAGGLGDCQPRGRFLVLLPVARRGASGRPAVKAERERAAPSGTSRRPSRNCRSDGWRFRVRWWP